MRIEVCHATALGATRIEVELPPGAALREAVEASRIVERLGLEGADLGLAVFGRRATGETILEEGDRVELLRPLKIDPMEARRRRAATKLARAQTKPPAG